MIESIELKNWKVHKHTKLTFKKGVNVLVGIMGAGKSSILDAISFGLFGSFPALSHKRVTLNGIIANRPTMENEAEVIVSFLIGEDEYKVTRKIVRDGSTTARLEKNDSYVQSQPSKVNEEIESILKIDYDTFSRVVYSEQNRLDYFLELAKGERKKQIDQMLGLDSFARAEENVVSLANRFKDIISGEEESIASIDIEKMKAELEDYTKKKNEYMKEQKELGAQKILLDKQAELKRKELAVAKAEYERKQKLQKELTEISSRLGTIRSEFAAITSTGDKAELSKLLEGKKKALDYLEKGIKALRDEERSENTKLMEIRSELKKLQDQKKEKDKYAEQLKGREVGKIEKEIKSTQDSLAISMENLATARSKKEENEKWMIELKKSTTSCPVCGAPLTPEHKAKLIAEKGSNVASAEKEIKSIESEIVKLQEKEKMLEKELRESSLASDKVEQYAGVEDKIKILEQAAKKQEEAHENVLKKVESETYEQEKLQKELAEISAKVAEAERKERYTRDIEKLSKELIEKESELKNISVDDKAISELQDVLKGMEINLAKIDTTMQKNSDFIKRLEEEIAEKAKSISEVAKRRERVQERKKLVSELSKFRAILADTEAFLRSELVKSINSLMQSIWPELYPYLDYASIRLNAKPDDYALEATIAGSGGELQWVDIESVASGGERSIACLALRIALAMVIVPNLKWLILDEPTHNLDENGISKLVEIMSNSLPKVVDQIFVITHDLSLRNINAARIYQVERNKNNDEYANVVEIG